MKKTNQNIDELVQQALQDYKEAHKTKVEMKYGNTYITVYENGVYARFEKLFELMRIRYSVDLQEYYDDDGKVVFNLSGDDAGRAAFIQKFVDNGYRLTWE